MTTLNYLILLGSIVFTMISLLCIIYFNSTELKYSAYSSIFFIIVTASLMCNLLSILVASSAMRELNKYRNNKPKFEQIEGNIYRKLH